MWSGHPREPAAGVGPATGAVFWLRHRRVESVGRLAGEVWGEEQLFCLEQARLSYAHFQVQLQECQQQIDQQMLAIQGRPVAAPPAAVAEAAPPSGKPAAVGKPQSFISAQLERILGVDLTQTDGNIFRGSALGNHARHA